MSETAVVWMAAFSQMLQKEESWSLKFEVFKHCGIFFTFLTRQSESAVFSWVVTTLSNPKVFVKYCSFSRECVAINASQPGLPPRRRPSLGRWLSYTLTVSSKKASSLSNTRCVHIHGTLKERQVAGKIFSAIRVNAHWQIAVLTCQPLFVGCPSIYKPSAGVRCHRRICQIQGWGARNVSHSLGFKKYLRHRL